MEIRQLKSFVAIAELGTFTAGAQRVHVTQAAISMQIRQLEEELGVQLFTRAPRRVLLTEAGEMLIERARRILREHAAALAEIAELTGAERGRLRIGSSSSSVTASALPQLLAALKKQHPQAEIAIHSGTSETLVAQILQGELDVAFVSLPVEAKGIETEVLMQDELVAIGSPLHTLARQQKLNAAELAREKLILGERGGNTRRMIDEFFADARQQPNIVMELNRTAAIRNMVAANMGIGLTPASSVSNEVRDGKIVVWHIQKANIRWELGLAHLSGGYHSPIARSFAKLCRQYYAASADKRAVASGAAKNKPV